MINFTLKYYKNSDFLWYLFVCLWVAKIQKLATAVSMDKRGKNSTWITPENFAFIVCAQVLKRKNIIPNLHKKKRTYSFVRAWKSLAACLHRSVYSSQPMYRETGSKMAGWKDAHVVMHCTECLADSAATSGISLQQTQSPTSNDGRIWQWPPHWHLY